MANDNTTDASGDDAFSGWAEALQEQNERDKTVDVEQGEQGTTVVLRRRIGRVRA